MADPKLVDIIKQGSQIWNSWREQQSEDLQIDLSKINLRGDNLRKIDLHNVNLNTANLRVTDLHGANLRGSSLRRTNLSGANLTDADLSGADLLSTNLNGANLYRADLSNATLIGAFLNAAILCETDLSGADLSGADLGRAILSGTILRATRLRTAKVRKTMFARVNLREAKGLAELKHLGPSDVALSTVQLPQDGGALHFLRGAGVTDEWIDDYRARMMRPIHYHSCFISYSSKDDSLAHRLHTDLQDKGVRCWFAPHDMHIGDKIRSRIDEAIHLQDKLLLILSEHSVASDWVEHEVETALAKERRDKRTILFPIRLDDAILERPYSGWAATVQNERHIGDFTGWKEHDHYQVAFDRLMRDLKKADE